MQDEPSTSAYYDLDRLFESFVKFLNRFAPSENLKEFVMGKFAAFCYGNVIRNFFDNLTPENMNEMKIPAAQTEAARAAFSKTLEDAALAIGLAFPDTLDKSYYYSFASRVGSEFSLLAPVLKKVEDAFDMEKLEKYIDDKRKAAESCGKRPATFTDLMMAQAVGNHLKRTNVFPKSGDLEGAIGEELQRISKSRAEETLQQVKEAMSSTIESERKELGGFENRLYDRWRKALDLLELMIILSSEIGQEAGNRMAKSQGENDKYLNSAIIRLHARAIRVSREILMLLKSGYADGANARWRSLHELSVISRFITQNGNDVARRYLEHDMFKRLKDARNYQTYHEQLRQPPPEEGTIEQLQEACDDLVRRYGESFRYRNGLEWIPKTILTNRDFKSLEKHVGMDKMRPYYDMSSNSVHGGAKGFFSLGLMGDKDVLLTGPSNAGLADPLYNTAYSLINMTLDVGSIKMDIEILIVVQATTKLLKEVRDEAQKAHDELEAQERARNNEGDGGSEG